MSNYLTETKNFHNQQYKKLKYSFQREFPNEDVIRFEKKFLKKKSKILDVGCGTGRNAIFLTEKNHIVHCMDFSKESIILLKKKFKKKKINMRNKIFLDFIPSMDKVSENYDAIVDCFTSYSLTKSDFIYYISNVSKKIKKKGLFHLQILSKSSDLFKKPFPAKIVFSNSIKRILRKTSPFYGDKYLFSFYSKNEIKEILSKHFKKVNIEVNSRTYRNNKEFLEFFVIDCEK